MAGRNMNVYFREETYSKIKSLIVKREISRFINEAVEEKLQKKQTEEKQYLKQQLIKGYQDRAKKEKLQEVLRVYGEISWSDVTSKLAKQEKNSNERGK